MNDQYDALQARFERVAAEVAANRGVILMRVQAAPSQPLVRDAAFHAPGNFLFWSRALIDLQETRLSDDDLRQRCEGACLELYLLPGGPPPALVSELQYTHGVQGWYL